MEWISTLISEADWGLAALLILLATGAFILSTISGGGGALVMVPALNLLMGVTNTAPVLNLGNFIGRPARLIIFWRHINWRVFGRYAPSAFAGAWVGAWIFSNFRVEWLQIVVGLFLISTIFQYRFGKKERSFTMKLWYFVPLGLVISIMGTIIGALGPVLNPFYLNMGIEKEALIATKTANSFFMGVAQISSYAFLGLLYGELWIYGLSIGIGAIVGNIIGKRFLSRMKSITFRRLVILLMAVSGFLLILGQIKNFIS